MTKPLIPEKRVDKTGKLVTRHVSAAPATARRSGMMPSPSIARQFLVPPADVKKPRRAGVTKSDLRDAAIIRHSLSVGNGALATGSVNMSDNELYEYMKFGVSIPNAVELKRYGADPETARYVPIARNMSIPQSVERMRLSGISPEDAARVIRHGINDRMLDRGLSDDELFGILYRENLHSTKHAARANGVHHLIEGSVTREDLDELGLEALGSYGGSLQKRREDGLPIDYEVIRNAIIRSEEKYRTLPSARRDEGWSSLDYAMGYATLMNLVDQHGPEVLDFRYLGILRMGSRFGGDIAGFRHMDTFFELTEGRTLALTNEQRSDLRNRGMPYSRVSDYVEKLRAAGLTPEQTVRALDNGLTIEQSIEIYINKQSIALIEGWL